MYWYKVELTGDQITKGLLEQIKNEFQETLRTTPNAWQHMAAYHRQHEKDYGETVYLYSEWPVYEDLFYRLFSATPCEPPPPSSVPPTGDPFADRPLILLVGDVNLHDWIMRALSSAKSTEK
jgi:hypothetical protein